MWSRSELTAKALAVVLVLAVAWLVMPYVSGLLGASVLYVVGAPAMRRVEGDRGRRVAAFVAVLVMFFVLVVPSAWLLVRLAVQVPAAVRSMEESAAMQRLTVAHIGSVSVGAQLDHARGDIVSWTSRQTIAALGGAIGATINLVIALFGAYYLLTSSARLWRRFQSRLPFPVETSDLLRLRFHRVTEAMLIGVVLTGVAQGVLVGVALALCGFDNALLWGAATGVASLLPIFGSGLVWGPAVVVLFAQGRATAALLLAVFGLFLVSNIDNALRLVVYRRVSHIHPMVTLVGAFAGVRAFGAAGLLLGPLVLSYAIELMRLSGIQEPAMAGARAA